MFLNVPHLNEAENQEFHECSQTYLNVNPCSLGYPEFPGEAEGNPQTTGQGGKELWKQTQLHFAIFLLYFTAVLNGRPVVECHRFVPIDSQLEVEDFSAVHRRCKYLANCWNVSKPKQRLMLKICTLLGLSIPLVVLRRSSATNSLLRRFPKESRHAVVFIKVEMHSSTLQPPPS